MKTEKVARSVYIVDDHAIVRKGLRELLAEQRDLQVCGEAESVDEALKGIAETRPALAIVDVSLRGDNGLDLVKRLRTKHPELVVLVISMHDEEVYAERAIRAGARGYIMKEEANESLLEAVRQVLDGKRFISKRLESRFLEKFLHPDNSAGSLVESLSDRELQVFEAIGKGTGTRQIADMLHLSVKTIETYREHIKRKLNLKNSNELLQLAIQWVQGGRA